MRSGVVGLVRIAVLVGALLVPTWGAGAQELDFDIPGGDAKASLAAWSTSTGIAIDAPDSVLQDLVTKPVKGRMEPRDALVAMISGASLEILADDGVMISLGRWAPRPSPPPPPAAPRPPKPANLPARLAGPFDYASATTEDLIQALARVGQPGPGLSSTASFQGFIAEDETFDFVYGVLGSPAPVVDPVMRELARRGPAALQALLRHLGDPRPTGLSVGGGEFPFSFQGFKEEYDARSPSSSCMLVERGCLSREFSGEYVLRIGDLCFTLVGQIVGRRLEAVRYQPTGNLFVNSPVQNPRLATLTRRDWGGVDANKLRASLLSDLEDTWRWRTAIPRLRLYFPDAYAGLSGLNRAKRLAYEFEVAAARRRQAGDDVPREPFDRELAACVSLSECLSLMDRRIGEEDAYLDEDEEAATAAKLYSFGDPAKQAVMARLTHPSRAWRTTALSILASWPGLADDELPALLLPLQFNGGTQVFDALFAIGSPAALRLILTEGARLDRYSWAGDAFSRAGPLGVTRLLQLLADPDLRAGAERLVTGMGGDADFAAISWAVIAVDPAAPMADRLAALRGLKAMGSYGEDAIPVIRPLVEDKDGALRRAADDTLRSLAIPR